ncbi:MAG: amino-acid N-acetyltransferase [Actinomycetota bacterium]|nr:amino-acid N-acetyltransferase [Actinomycetota bacterium]
MVWIRELVRPLAGNTLTPKDPVAYYEALQQFRVAEDSSDPAVPGRIIGCGALHVMWDELAEVRTLAVHPDFAKRGVGGRLLETLLDDARALGLRRIFCLTFEVDFFTHHGFSPIMGQAAEPEVYAELLRSYDEGVAEFLDLERVKPNTLGNTRMLRIL